MSVHFGASQIPFISKGQTSITAIYRGSQVVYRVGFDPVTFTANGTWKVPPGIKQIRVDCVGTQGFSTSASVQGGLGGRVQCLLNVTSGQVLYIVVGIANTSYVATYNASDIRTSSSDLNSRLIVAGGGGSAGISGARGTSYGGAGGGLVGGNGGIFTANDPFFGYGGTQTAGGAISTGNTSPYSAFGSPGTFGMGGNGAPDNAGHGGPGGAGWYGGGGGGVYDYYGGFGAGGGGGSSYTHPTLCAEVVHTQGYKAGNGYITISMV